MGPAESSFHRDKRKYRLGEVKFLGYRRLQRLHSVVIQEGEEAEPSKEKKDNNSGIAQSMNSYFSSVFTTEDYVNFPTQDCIVDKKLANIGCCVNEDIRDNWTKWFHLAVTTAENVGVVPSMPHRTNQQQHGDNVPAQTPSDYYKRAVAIPLLDHLQSEMKTYSNPPNDGVLSSLFNLLPEVVAGRDRNPDIGAALEFYESNFPSPHVVDVELLRWKRKAAHCESSEYHGKAQHRPHEKLFTTAFFVAKNEKPYPDFANLTELQASNYGDDILTKRYNNDKQANEFIHYIAKHESDLKWHKRNGSEFIAVALDGSTNSANIEQESYFVSYLDENYEPCVDFVKIVGVQGCATGQNLADGFFCTLF
ncbi:52 kDa repressor of the inhibitor of the protein kinase [Stylophora pistillata]|uniref:52 kDa repressor of the inhibitor of the protein kinase n=1 Tax=Stylophora pistillata TaxID=50429 RepID=A0A2B4S8J7_STYPI|nr:52 kDa repressor of the inhibitor of the protein kinase [Stylophora pistillata]